MDNRKYIVGQESRSILEAASGKRIPVKITQNLDNNWYIYKANLMAVQANRLVFSHPVPDTTECPMEPGAGQQIAVTFKKGYNKFLFVTRVIGSDKLEIDPGVYMPVLVVFRPEHLERIQRRAYDRVTIESEEPIRVTIKGATGAKGTWQGVLVDLSAGGVGLEINSDLRSALVDGEQYDVSFIPLPGQEMLQLRVRLRHMTDHPQKPGQSMLGFQTIGLELSEEGRKTIRQIGRIVNVYKRRAPIDQHDELSRQY